jgi:hypothetical protein
VEFSVFWHAGGVVALEKLQQYYAKHGHLVAYTAFDLKPGDELPGQWEPDSLEMEPYRWQVTGPASSADREKQCEALGYEHAPIGCQAYRIVCLD